jgi:hypothetical protein
MMMNKLNFDSAIGFLEGQLDAMESATRALKDSKNLRKVLEMALAFGNILNASNNKAAAFGFRLATLEKVSPTSGAPRRGAHDGD